MIQLCSQFSTRYCNTGSSSNNNDNNQAVQRRQCRCFHHSLNNNNNNNRICNNNINIQQQSSSQQPRQSKRRNIYNTGNGLYNNDNERQYLFHHHHHYTTPSFSIQSMIFMIVSLLLSLSSSLTLSMIINNNIYTNLSRMTMIIPVVHSFNNYHYYYYHHSSAYRYKTNVQFHNQQQQQQQRQLSTRSSLTTVSAMIRTSSGFSSSSNGRRIDRNNICCSSTKHTIIETTTTTTTTTPRHRNQQKQQLIPPTTTIMTTTITSDNTLRSSKNDGSRNHNTNYNNKKRYNNKNDNDIEQQITLLGRQGRTDEALEIFWNHTNTVQQQQQQSSLSLMITIRQINAIIDACARGRPVRLETAFYILNTYTTATTLTIIPSTITSSSNSTTTASTKSIKSSSNKLPSMINKSYKKLQPNVYTYGALMNVISRLGEVDLALHVLNYMKTKSTNSNNSNTIVQPNVVVYQSAITAAANAARPDIALQLLQNATNENIPITVIGYNAAITAASRAKNYTLAIQLLRQMQQQQQQQNDNTNHNNHSTIPIPQPDIVTYGTVMAACEQCNEWSLVLQFAQEIENCTQTTTTNNNQNQKNNKLYLDGMAITSALKACQQLGYASMAMYYLDQMKLLLIKKNESIKTFGRERIGSKQPLQGPDAVAYRLAISACARGGAWQDGIKLLNEYCNTVNDHDVVAYTAAITGCEYSGQWIDAVQLLIRMRQIGKVQPNVVTFAAVIGACATACAKLNDNNNSNNNNNTYKQIQNINGKGEMPLPQKKALQILGIMKKDVNVVKPNIQVYNAAIRTCAEALDMKRAFQLYHMLQDDDKLQPNIITYGTLMLACERVGSITGMDQVFTYMRQNDIIPNEIIYGTAISCCRKAGDSQRAYTLFEKMVRNGYQPNVATINTVLIAQIENNNNMINSNTKNGITSTVDFDRAETIFKNYFVLPQNSTSSEATTTNYAISPSRQSYSIMIRAYASNRRPKDAEGLLRRMRTIDNMIPDVDLYTMTVSSYERIGQPLNALRLMESMRADGYDFYDVDVLNTIFKRLIKLVNAVGQTLGKTND